MILIVASIRSKRSSSRCSIALVSIVVGAGVGLLSIVADSKPLAPTRALAGDGASVLASSAIGMDSSGTVTASTACSDYDS